MKSGLNRNLSWLAAVSFLATGAAAQDVPGQCRGMDMLAEMSISDPALHKSVIEQAAKLENTAALLWKIETKSGAVSYLFGTMHLTDSRITTLPDKLTQTITSSKTVALEVADLSDAALGAALGGAAELVAYTDGQTLDKILTSGEFKKVQSVVAKSGLPGEAANVFKPWLISTLIAMSDCERQQIDAGIPVLDMRIGAVAKAADIPVVSLETIEQQLQAMASVPETEQVQMLKAGLAYLDRTPDMLETLLQLYLKRQMGAAMPFQIALAGKTGVPASAFDGFQRKLLVERNLKMRDNMKPLLDKGGAFVAVGALHLPGKTGLVSLLNDAGYTVTPAE